MIEIVKNPFKETVVFKGQTTGRDGLDLHNPYKKLVNNQSIQGQFFA